MKFVKKPVPLSVVFSLVSGEVQTREGVVRFEQGDAVATGIEGERWPIGLKHFAATYVPVPPLEFGQNGNYQKRHLPVDACQISEPLTVDLSAGQGTLSPNIGDWLLTVPNGEKWVVADSIFKLTYIAIDKNKP